MDKGYVFGLDIGTRNIVGVVGSIVRNRFKVSALVSKEHETRAMLDGQIHDIYKVGDTIRSVKNSLEKQLGTKLTDVCIAAAGRVLKTVDVSAEYTFEEETRVNQEHIYSLNLLAVEKAHMQLNENSTQKFYCVGNTPIKYRLNGYDINNLEGHKANSIGVDLIATFLPEEVVDGLYEAVDYAGLSVASLTLEPIAAMNIAIPENYRLLNIALIDVGAGTSDICITRDGSIVAYGMIPFAGDELTEVIAKECLVDFNAAEKIKLGISKKKGSISYKDIMGLPQKIEISRLNEIIAPTLKSGAKCVAEKIKELNGGKSVNAVFVVGGGGKIPGYTELVAEYLGIASERVAVRGEEVLTSVDFAVEDYKKDALYVTPVGICTNFYNQKNNFMFVTVNGQRVKLYDNNHLTVVDAVMQVGYPNENLFPKRGKELQFSVNGKVRMVRGNAGEGAIVRLNGSITNLNAQIQQNDVIQIDESTAGSKAECSIGQLEEFNSNIEFTVNGKNILCPRFAYVNGKLESEFYKICDDDNVLMENFYTIGQLFSFLDLPIDGLDIYVNNEPADENTRVYENFNVRFEESKYVEENLADKLFDEPVKAHKRVVQTNESFNAAETVNDDKLSLTDEEGVEKADEEKPHDIAVIVNGTPVILSGKSRYVVVDIFSVYPFDTSTPKGELIFNVNDKNAEYLAPLNHGDTIELRWSEDK